MKKRVKWKKWILLGICLAFLVGLFCYWNREDELYSDVRLFSDGEQLFFNDRKKEKIFSYNPESERLNDFLDESIDDIYSNDKYYFYSCQSGVYAQERTTGKKDVIIEYGKEKADRMKEHQGQKLLNTSVGESGNYFCEYDGKIYFVYNAEVQLKPHEHLVIGTENWFTLYCYDVKAKTLSALKSDHSTMLYDEYDESKDAFDDEAVMFDMHIAKDKIYYRTHVAVHCLTLDGREDSIVYLFKGSVKQFDWTKDGFYCFEAISGVNYLEAFDYNGEMMNSYQLREDVWLSWGIGMSLAYYDEKTDTYLTFSNEKLIRFSSMDPEKYTIITNVEENEAESFSNLITIEDSIYIATWNSYKHNDYDYRIIEVNGQNEIKVIIDSDKN